MSEKSAANHYLQNHLIPVNVVVVDNNKQTWRDIIAGTDVVKITNN